MDTQEIVVETQIRRIDGALSIERTLDEALALVVKEANPIESTFESDFSKISFSCYGGRVILRTDGTWQFAKSN